jgi:hypothetical protein
MSRNQNLLQFRVNVNTFYHSLMCRMLVLESCLLILFVLGMFREVHVLDVSDLYSRS